MRANSNSDLSGAAARKLTMEGLKEKFQTQRKLEAYFGRSELDMDVPFSYQREFLEYIVGLTGYTIRWHNCSPKIVISW
jgi:hypothetical protein